MMGWGCHNWAIKLKYFKLICGLVSWAAKTLHEKQSSGEPKDLEVMYKTRSV